MNPFFLLMNMKFSRKLLKYWDITLSITCAVLLIVGGSFIWGYLVSERHIFPYPFVQKIQTALGANLERVKQQRAVQEKDQPLHDRFKNLWFPANDSRTGVVIYDSAKCCSGLTFFTTHTTKACLIDMEGNLIHEWFLPFGEVWPNPTHLLDTVSELLIYWRKAHLFPNGDILAIYEGVGQSPYGGGLVKINKDSQLIWKVSVNAHHDLDVAPDGRIFVLTHQYKKEGPHIADAVTIVSKDGKILNTISIYDAFRNSKYAHMVPFEPVDDYLHTNSIEVLFKDTNRFPVWLAAGDILLTHRNKNLASIMDGKTHRIKWILGGLFAGLHDGDFLEDGTLAFFDDGRPNFGGNAGSRIVAYDLFEKKPVWVYSTGDNRFYSEVRGSQQKLPNGNYLITEAARGRLIEVTPQKEVVWKYVTPWLSGESVGLLNTAERYERHSLPFVETKKRDL